MQKVSENAFEDELDNIFNENDDGILNTNPDDLKTEEEKSKYTIKALNKIYKMVLNGVSGMDSAYELAGKYSVETIDRMIKNEKNFSMLPSGLSAFGGILTVAISLPVAITACLFLRARLAAAIALINGHDLNNKNVRLGIYLAICGKNATDVAKKAGGVLCPMMITKFLTSESVYLFLDMLCLLFGRQILGTTAKKFLPGIGAVIAAVYERSEMAEVGRVSKLMFSKN